MRVKLIGVVKWIERWLCSINYKNSKMSNLILGVYNILIESVKPKWKKIDILRSGSLAFTLLLIVLPIWIFRLVDLSDNNLDISFLTYLEVINDKWTMLSSRVPLETAQIIQIQLARVNMLAKSVTVYDRSLSGECFQLLVELVRIEGMKNLYTFDGFNVTNRLFYRLETIIGLLRELQPGKS